MITRDTWSIGGFCRAYGVPLGDLKKAIETGQLSARIVGALLLIDDRNGARKWLENYRDGKKERDDRTEADAQRTQ